MEQLKRLPLLSVYALLIYMPLHVFLSQWLSTFTGGLAVWKVAKDAITIALVLLSIILVIATKSYKKTPYLLLIMLASAYLLLHIGLYFFNKDTSIQVASLATVYNNRILWYLIIGLSAALLVSRALSLRKISKIILVTSTILVVIGLLQYFLPKDLMTHFGYSLERGARPAFFIDDKPDLPRIMSTIRDPNSFGAFLIIPILLLCQKLLGTKDQRKRRLFLGLLMLHGLALVLTFSRGAWAGLFISLVSMATVHYRHTVGSWAKRYWRPLALGIAAFICSGFLLRDQYLIQNVIFHSDENTISAIDSNDYHLQFAQTGLNGIIKNPLGYGPGTAGIVSIQNKDGGLLTENYFIQIGYEVGIAGLLLFFSLLALIFYNLKTYAPIYAVVVASGLGLMAMSLISHLWTNEAVAAIWWLLAGLAIGWKVKAKASVS